MPRTKTSAKASPAPSRNGTPGRTAFEVLLVAAAELEAAGRVPFGAEDLTVRAFALAPGQFGLDGFDLPNHHTTMVALSGPRGAVRRGWLDRVAPGRYRLGAAGRGELPRVLRVAPAAKGPSPKRLSAGATAHLDAVLKTLVWSRYKQNLLDLVPAEAAERFLAIGDLGATAAELAEVTAGGPVILSTGQVADANLAAELRACEAALVGLLVRRPVLRPR